jgi:ABC-2 type transport system permease protein
MAALAAIGLAISTLTEHPIGAIAALLLLAVASEVADNVAQFVPFAVYIVIFGSLAWARFTSADVTS